MNWLQALRPPSGEDKREPFDALKLATPAGRAFLTDPTRHRAGPAGRGAGKTTHSQFEGLRVATTIPGCSVLILADTIGRAKAIVWDELKEWSEPLGGESNENDLLIRFPNGSRFFVSGADNIKTFSRKKGIKRIALVILIECQDWDSQILQWAVTKVFMPRLGDLEASHGVKGRIIMEGTGAEDVHAEVNGVSANYWADVAAGRTGFGVHTWTQWDNPHIADPDGEFIEACKAAKVEWFKLDEPIPPKFPGGKPRTVDTNDPLTRREWFAEFNSGPSDLRVWAHAEFPDIELPSRWDPAWRFAWGIDIASSSDNDALVVLGWSPDDGERRVYEVDSWQAPGSEDYEDLAEVLRAKKEQWRPSCAVFDTDGHGAQKIANTVRNRLGIPINVTKPRDVEHEVRLMNGDIRAGRLRVREGALRDDMKFERWKVLPSGARVLKGGYHSDLTAGLRYAWRAQYAFRSEAPPPPMTPIEEREMKIREQVAKMESASKRSKGWRR